MPSVSAPPAGARPDPLLWPTKPAWPLVIPAFLASPLPIFVHSAAELSWPCSVAHTVLVVSLGLCTHCQARTLVHHGLYIYMAFSQLSLAMFIKFFSTRGQMVSVAAA